MIGKVVGVSGHKTVKVCVQKFVTHSLYRKTMKVTKNYLCHSDLDGVDAGSMVEIKECRPISARKNFVVVKVVSSKR